MSDDENTVTPATEQAAGPKLREQILSRISVIWKPLLLICAVPFCILVIAVWLALAHHGNGARPAGTVPTTDVTPIDEPPPPPPPERNPPAPKVQTPNEDARKVDTELNKCGGAPCPSNEPPANPPNGAPATNPGVSPQQEYEQKLKQYQLAAAFASPDEQVGEPPQQSQPQSQAPPTPSAQAPAKPFPPVSTPEEEIGQEKNASYDSSTGPQYRLFGGVDSIPARLENEIIGDFDGPFQAVVTKDIWSLHHEACLIPQGAKLIGRYHRVSDGDQERLQAEIYKMWMPDGWTTSFEPSTVLDAAGATGLTGKVNHHYAQLFLTSIGISAVGAGAQIGNYQSSGYNYDPAVALQNGVTIGSSQAAQDVLSRKARIRSTIKVPAGSLIDLQFAHDVVFPDWHNHQVNPHI
jgi:type IV secretory pathway VirB10-like protein